MSTLTIGKLAQAAGVNVETIRYYQRRGLLHTPAKGLRGQRRYPADTARRLRFIKRAQALGFTLAEIGELLRLDGESRCTETHDLAVAKLALIEEKIAQLAAMRHTLARLVGQCGAEDSSVVCPIIQALAQD